MSDERQNLQLELALHGAGEGEAQISREQGTESRVVKGVTENPATERLMEEVCDELGLPRLAPRLLNPPNRRIRTRTYGGVGGAESRGSPLSRFRSKPSETVHASVQRSPQIREM